MSEDRQCGWYTCRSSVAGPDDVYCDYHRPLDKSTANDTPVGGRHYHRGDQPQCWDRQWLIGGPAFFVGSVESYVERYRLKGGVADLEKARHYLQKLIELERAYAAGGPAPGVFGKSGMSLDPLPPEKL